MQPIPQPDRNHRQPTDPEAHPDRQRDSNQLDPIPQPDWPAQRRNTREEPTMTTATLTTIDWTRLHAELSHPFADSDIRYRAGATNRDKTKAQALPYVDPRSYEDRLNQIVPGAWEVTFEPWGEHRIICRLTIHGVTRSSTGEASDSPDGIAGTSAEAQAFKRACAKFGLGRHLYGITPRWADYDAQRRTITPPSPGAPKVVEVTHTHPQDARPEGTADAIGRQRADAMSHALEAAGIPRRQHVTFARLVLKRQVTGLPHLSESDAATVWAAARQASPAPVPS